jgi:hypothetical protein
MPLCNKIEGVLLWIKCMAQVWFFLLVHGGWWTHAKAVCLLLYSILCPSETQLFSVHWKYLLESKILLEIFLKCLCSPLVCISENKLSLFKIFVFTLDVQSPAFSWTVYNSCFKLIICLAVAWHSVHVISGTSVQVWREVKMQFLGGCAGELYL